MNKNTDRQDTKNVCRTKVIFEEISRFAVTTFLSGSQRDIMSQLKCTITSPHPCVTVHVARTGICGTKIAQHFYSQIITNTIAFCLLLRRSIATNNS